MTPTPEPQPTAREHLLSLRAQGFSLAEIGRQIGRSPRALQFVLKGERDGAALIDSLAELDYDGKVTHQAPRPVTKDGHRIKVRGKGGRLVEPPAPKGAGIKRARARATTTAPTTVQQLITAARADGLTYKQIGDLVGRSAEAIRKVHTGQRGAAAAEALRTPLVELYTTGTVTHQAQRAVTRSGDYAKIRGADGTYVEPKTPKGSKKPAPRKPAKTSQKIEPRPGRIPSTGANQPSFLDVPTTPPSTRRGRAKPQGPVLQHQPLPGGGHFYQGTVSKTGRKDRATMNSELLDVINGASNSLRRVQLKITLDGEDHPIQIGGKSGYDPATIAAALEANGGNMWNWLDTQLDRNRYGGLGDAPITNVQIHVW